MPDKIIEGVVKFEKSLGKFGILLVGVEKDSGQIINCFHSGLYGFPDEGQGVRVTCDDYILKQQIGSNIPLKIDGKSNFRKILSFEIIELR